MRSVVAFLACTGFIIWAHSCDTRIVGLKAYATQPSNPPVYKQEMTRPDMATTRPVLLAHYMHDLYLDTVSVHTGRTYPD